MLYISRYVGEESFGVVDTDDNTEEIVSYAELSNLVCHRGVVICGAKPVRGVDGEYWITEDDIFVCQPSNLLSNLQVKTRVLRHIDVIVYNSMITSVLVYPREMSKHVEIRLSDFGTSCGDFILSRNQPSHKCMVTLKLDDKLDFGKDTFSLRFCDNAFVGLRDVGVKFDFCELSDAKAEKAYDYILPISGPNMHPVYIDRLERVQRMRKKRLGV